MKKCFKFLISLIFCLNLSISANNRILTQNNHAIPVVINQDRLEKIKEKGVLTVLSPNIEPYSYKNPNSGDFTGLDADIITEVAKRLGINEVQVKYVNFPYIVESLLNNPEADMIAKAIYITKDRKNILNFTNPIYTEGETILTRNDTKIFSKTDLKNKTVGTFSNTVFLDLASDWKKQNLLKDYIAFHDNTSLILSLKNKLVDAIITDSMQANNLILKESNSNFKVLSPNQYKTELTMDVSYPFKKEDITLVNAFNEKLQEMKSDGTLYNILTQYGLTSHYINN
ncbi:ABC transporter substrate-binding protein [Clostridium sp. SHJSY1]|uniref:substrate-binding periplasmic protein n=1 Tax=Clostridium sp. SHJSY1 TaxID=2942483 RepID=UPI002874442D|nr:ABC transporter substrate-binding protein [Clostridium sp. SHJSY1]MDS0526973.1 ABC transporter substrate-binding protein [Clostridium sp. SHJSY1]